METQEVPLIDDKGRRILGDPTKGCKFCGRTEIEYTGNSVVYRRALECCPEAVALMISRRLDELATLKKTFAEVPTKERENVLRAAYDELKELKVKLEHMEASA